MIEENIKQKQVLNRLKIRRGPDGVHIFDRMSGTNILLDEKVPPLVFWADFPRQVSIALTNACDLICVHCYAAKKPANLNKEVVKLWLLELDGLGSFGVGFGGGEPTLHPDIVELCQYGHENTSLAISLTTHAHRLTSDLVAQLKPYVNFLRVSMDGVGPTYEAIRGRSFSALIKKINLLSGNISFGINFVVNRNTIGDLSAAVEIAANSGAVEFLLLPEEGVGLGKKIDLQTIERLKEWIRCYRGGMRLSISASYQSFINTQLPLVKEPAHLAFVHIDAEGKMKETSFDKEGLKIGSDSLLEVFKRLPSMTEDII